MKKGIILLFFCCSFNWFSFNILSAKWLKKELAKDLRTVLMNQAVDLEESAEDLIFEYKIYKKLIQDSLLDELIENAGLEPNQENRMIFFSAISKDLQDHIKESFSDFSDNKNQSENRNQHPVQDYPNRSNFNGMDPSFYYQAEMTRGLYSMLPFMNSRSDESKGIKIRHLVLGGVIIYFFTKFGVISTGIKVLNKYIKTTESVGDLVSKVGEKFSDAWNAMIHGRVVQMSRKELSDLGARIGRLERDRNPDTSPESEEHVAENTLEDKVTEDEDILENKTTQRHNNDLARYEEHIKSLGPFA